MNNKITGVAWFTAGQSVGIITTIDIQGKIKARCGFAQRLEPEISTLHNIRVNGAQFPIIEAQSLIQQFGRTLDIEYNSDNDLNIVSYS